MVLICCVFAVTNLKDSQGDGMWEVLLTEYNSVSCPSVHVDAGQSVQLWVNPVQTTVGHVCSERDRELICLSVYPKSEAAAREPAHTESDAIRPHNVIGHQGKAVHSIQPTLLYFGLFTPVCPVHEAKEDKDQFKNQQTRILVRYNLESNL